LSVSSQWTAFGAEEKNRGVPRRQIPEEDGAFEIQGNFSLSGCLVDVKEAPSLNMFSKEHQEGGGETAASLVPADQVKAGEALFSGEEQNFFLAPPVKPENEQILLRLRDFI
jgi:hypothetical protein